MSMYICMNYFSSRDAEYVAVHVHLKSRVSKNAEGQPGCSPGPRRKNSALLGSARAESSGSGGAKASEAVAVSRFQRVLKKHCTYVCMYIYIHMS